MTVYFAVFAVVFVRVSTLVNNKRSELKITRGITQDESGHSLTYIRFLPTILAAAARWPITIIWNGLYAFLRELM